MCNKNIVHRIESVDTFQLSVALELFYFGRPIFEMLTPLGFDIRETIESLNMGLNRKEIGGKGPQ